MAATAALPSLRSAVHAAVPATPSSPLPALRLPKPLFHLTKSFLQSIHSPLDDHCLPSRAPSSAVRAAADAFSDIEDYEESEQLSKQPVVEKSRPRPAQPEKTDRLYVGNLPFSMTPAQLGELFGEAGTVEKVEVVYDRVTDRSRGFAFVTLASSEEALEAIRMFDGSQVGGRAIKVNFPEVPRGGEREVMMTPWMRAGGDRFTDSPYKIYAGNLGWSLTSQALHDTFASQQGFLGARVIYNRDTGRSKGFGFVSFASAEECQAAMEALNGLEVEGRPLRLNLAEGRPNISASENNGQGAGNQESSFASRSSSVGY